MSTNPLDPAYWEALGIKPIVIDPSNPESIENAKEEITQRIVDFVEESKPNTNQDKAEGTS